MNGVIGLANYIAKVVNANKKNNATFRGQINGNSIWVGNKSYPFTLAIDININSGDYVWCILNDSKTKAVIVGA